MLLQARFLLAKLNPSTTHASSDQYANSGEMIYTDDVSLKVRLCDCPELASSPAVCSPERCYTT